MKELYFYKKKRQQTNTIRQYIKLSHIYVFFVCLFFFLSFLSSTSISLLLSLASFPPCHNHPPHLIRTCWPSLFTVQPASSTTIVCLVQVDGDVCCCCWPNSLLFVQLVSALLLVVSCRSSIVGLLNLHCWTAELPSLDCWFPSWVCWFDAVGCWSSFIGLLVFPSSVWWSSVIGL